MPTRKIKDADARFKPCRHPEHNPPSMMVYQPGEYEHECPACHHVTRFSVHPHHFLQEKPIMTLPKPQVDWDGINQQMNRWQGAACVGRDPKRVTAAS